eukprot:scaffold65538_cov87-Phaeocystis_antarctica.AAC.1
MTLRVEGCYHAAQQSRRRERARLPPGCRAIMRHANAGQDSTGELEIHAGRNECTDLSEAGDRASATAE